MTSHGATLTHVLSDGEYAVLDQAEWLEQTVA